MNDKLYIMYEIEKYESSIIELEKWDFKSNLSNFTKELIEESNIKDEDEKLMFINGIRGVINRLKNIKSVEDGKLYLSEIIAKEKPDFGLNNLILSPTGSGKTSFIKLLAKGAEGKDSLLLVSTTSLKRKLVPIDEKEREHLSNRMYSTKQKKIYGPGEERILVMTYYEFGEKMRYSYDFAKKFSRIFCDEVHSLIAYQSYENSVNLFILMRYLFENHEGQTIYHFTATSEHIDKLRDLSDEIMRDVKIFNYLDNPDIKRYISLSSYKIHGIEQIRSHLIARKESFKYFGYKIFAFCKTIESQKRMKKICEEEGYSAQAYWSVNNEEKPMSDEQKEEMEKMIKEGLLPDKYDVVIINSALQEGWDLKDPRVKLAIINTRNETEHIQALGRIRGDLDVLVYKVSQDEEVDFFIDFPLHLLDKPLDTNMKKELISKFNLRDKQGRLLRWTSISKILEKQGFIIKTKRFNVDNKRKTFTIVTPR